MMKYQKLLLTALLLMCARLVSAQTIEISGKVIEQETGLPLPGASIGIKETSDAKPVISDSNGGFSISASPGQTLTITFIGYTAKEVRLSESVKGPLTIALDHDSRQLSEVVITGAFGIKRAARELGTSATLVENETLNQGKTINPLFGLSSKVAGLRINMYDSKVDPAVQITMRGTRSLQRSSGIDGRPVNAPIYVVDGMPVPSIGRLNPNDIESITVLKGANAAALYGSEGVNGALMITTKKGARGKGTVEASNTTTFSTAFLLPPAQNEFGQGANGAYSPTQYESWGPRFDGSMRDFGIPLPDGTQPQLLYAAPSSDRRLGLFQTGINTQNDLSFSGGDENSTYFLSAQYVSQTGIIPEDKNRRIGLRFNGSRNFSKLKTSYNINYINNDKSITPDGPWIGAYQLPANFDYNLIKDWESANSPGNPNNYFIVNNGQLRNPYFLIDNIRNDNLEQILNGKVDLSYEFTPWFEALYRIGIYSSSEEGRNSTRKFQSTRNNVLGAVEDANTNYRRLNSDLILNFKKDLGDFSNRLLLGQNLRSDYKKENSISSGNLLYPDLLNPGSRVGELGGAVTITEYRSMAVYGELSSGYKNFVFLTLTGRNDWVSVLSKENRSYFYPGISTSFIASEALPFLQNSRRISFAKVFASWNKSGNVPLAPYQLNNAYTQQNGFPFGNTVGFLPGLTNQNPNIEPEFVNSYEAGLQLGLFNNRINFEGAYVYSDSDGQILNATASRGTGYNIHRVNAGKVTNRIFELSADADIIRNNDLRWNVGFNFTHTKNEVKELVEGLTNINNFRQSYAMVGEQFPSLLVSDYRRDPQGRIVVGNDGVPLVAAENTNLGTLIPPYLMGLSTRLSFKGLSIGAQFDWRMGGWLYSEIVPRMYTAGTHPATVQYGREDFIWPNSVKVVQEEVRNAAGEITVPAVYADNDIMAPGGRSTWSKVGEIQMNTAAKSNFFKFRELNVSYAIPGKFLGAQKFVRGASIGLIANNLFIIRHKDNTMGDPEYLYNNTDGYLSFRQVPPMRSIGFNVNLKF